MPSEVKIGEVIDLFCGVGGISYGFKRAGFSIIAGYDIDDSCRYAYETNNDARFICKSIEQITPNEIRSRFSGNVPTVLVGCAPCQPFSSYKKGKIDDRWELLSKFTDLALGVQADYFTMENVSGLMEYRGGEIFYEFISRMSERYKCSYSLIDCSEYGVPQKRKRLVVIGAIRRKLTMPSKEITSKSTVRQVIANLPKLAAGEICEADPLHRSSRLSELNLMRIKNSIPGGTWRDWPQQIVADCHKKEKGKGYGGVYGRMDWDLPSPTMTTQCYGYGNGRFGHPDQDRAITLREAALLQSFPPDYKFFENNKFPGFRTVGRWIGNAVPVTLAETIAKTISKDISQR